MNDKVLEKRKSLRLKRKMRVKAKCGLGSATRPRVSIFKSNKYFYAQAIDDCTGNTLAAINSRKMGLGNNKADAEKVGQEFATTLKQKGIENILFDRNGYLYHGVVAAFADGIRSVGIKL